MGTVDRRTAKTVVQVPAVKGLMGELIYAHCALRAARRPAMSARWPRMPGGSAPRAFDLGDELWVIVSSVPGRDYEEPCLTQRLGDAEWLAGCGVAHHEVIARVARTHTVAPFRLLTLFRSEQRVVEETHRLRSKIVRALARVDDRREWVVRVAAVSRAASSPRTRRSSGTMHLMARAAQATHTTAATPVARRVARELVAELKGYADRVVQRRSEAAHVLYDGALLVSRAREQQLGDVVRQWVSRLAPAGCRVSLTGPWPPYSFVSLDGRGSTTSHDRA